MKDKEAKKLVMQGMTTLVDKVCELHAQIVCLTGEIEKLKVLVKDSKKKEPIIKPYQLKRTTNEHAKKYGITGNFQKVAFLKITIGTSFDFEKGDFDLVMADIYTNKYECVFGHIEGMFYSELLVKHLRKMNFEVNDHDDIQFFNLSKPFDLPTDRIIKKKLNK